MPEVGCGHGQGLEQETEHDDVPLQPHGLVGVPIGEKPGVRSLERAETEAGGDRRGRRGARDPVRDDALDGGEVGRTFASALPRLRRPLGGPAARVGVASRATARCSSRTLEIRSWCQRRTARLYVTTQRRTSGRKK
ncbi:MAG: hypothetical protein OEM05_13200 [Myxococcales bacterium]|nr:hypothetical protein [Myxococcales bacterium]